MSGNYPNHPYVSREQQYQQQQSNNQHVNQQNIGYHMTNQPVNQSASQMNYQMSNPSSSGNAHVSSRHETHDYHMANQQAYQQPIQYGHQMQRGISYESNHSYQFCQPIHQPSFQSNHMNQHVQQQQYWSNTMEDLAELPMIQSLIGISDDEFDLRSHVGTAFQPQFTQSINQSANYSVHRPSPTAAYDYPAQRSSMVAPSPVAEPVLQSIKNLPPVPQYPVSQTRIEPSAAVRYPVSNEAIKDEIRSPASTTQNSGSHASPKSFDSMDGISTNSTSSSDPAVKVSTKTTTISRLPFSFIVHLRSGDRSFVPRRVITSLDRDISDLLYHAAGVRDFVAAHTEGATRTVDGRLDGLPIAQARLNTALTDPSLNLDCLPPLQSAPPVLLPANTQLGMPFVPPLGSSKKTPNIDSDEDDTDVLRHTSANKAPASDQVTYLSDAVNIHVLFDLNENTKPCTRLGCINMMLKKSSRRACDECQSHGHRIDPALLRKIFVPENRSLLSPQSTDPVIRDFLSLPFDQSVLVVNQLNEAIDTALVSTRVEYWKFHIPEEQSYVYAFVSQEAAECVINDFERLLNPYYVGKSVSSSAASTLAFNSNMLVMNMTVTMNPQTGHNDAYESSRSRSQEGQSDSELEPRLVRKNSHSHSRSSNSTGSIPSSASRSSGDLVNDRSTMSTTSTGSSNSGGAAGSDTSLPVRAGDVDSLFCAQLPNLVPNYLYSNHVQNIDNDLEYWVRMKSHFWKLEVQSKISSSAHKQPKTKSYRKVGKATKRPSNRKRLAMHNSHQSLNFAHSSTQQERSLDGRPQMSTAFGVLPPFHQKQYLNEPSWPSHDRNAHDRNISSMNGSREPVSGTPFRSSDNAGLSSRHTITQAATNMSSCVPMDQRNGHTYQSTALPVFQDEHPLARMTDDLPSPLMDFPTDNFDMSPLSHTHLDNNSVLIHAMDHNQLAQQKPIGAMLNIYDGTRSSVAVGSRSEMHRVSQTPVLLVYRDPRVFQNDVRQGYLPPVGGNGNGGGSSGNNDGSDRYHDQDRKDGSGGNQGARRRDDFDDRGDGNGKRRRIDAHHLALDAPGSHSPIRLSDKVRGVSTDVADQFDDDVTKKPSKQDELKPALLANIVAVQSQSLNIWLSLLVLISTFSVALFVVNFALEDTPLNVLHHVKNPSLINNHQRSTLANAANIFNQMRVASSIFNSWIHNMPSSNLILVDDDPDTDIAYSFSMRQLDIVPGSVFHKEFAPHLIVKASGVSPKFGTVLTYADVVQRCGEASDTAKGVADFLVSANSLGHAFSYHFIGTELSSANTSLDDADSVDDSDEQDAVIIDDEPPRDPGLSHSSTGSSLRPSSTFQEVEVSSTDELPFILDWQMSTLSYPPKPNVTCSLLDNDVGRTYIKSSLCAAVVATRSPYAYELEERCQRPEIDCEAFLTDLFRWNLTNVAFAIETAVYNTDALLIALHYRQEVAALAPVCSYFQIVTHEQLDMAIEGSLQGEINVTILLLLILSGSALFVILLGIIVYALFIMKQEYEKRHTPVPAHAIVAVPLQYHDDHHRLQRRHGGPKNGDELQMHEVDRDYQLQMTNMASA